MTRNTTEWIQTEDGAVQRDLIVRVVYKPVDDKYRLQVVLESGEYVSIGVFNMQTVKERMWRILGGKPLT